MDGAVSVSDSRSTTGSGVLMKSIAVLILLLLVSTPAPSGVFPGSKPSSVERVHWNDLDRTEKRIIRLFDAGEGRLNAFSRRLNSRSQAERAEAVRALTAVALFTSHGHDIAALEDWFWLWVQLDEPDFAEAWSSRIHRGDLAGYRRHGVIDVKRYNAVRVDYGATGSPLERASVSGTPLSSYDWMNRGYPPVDPAANFVLLCQVFPHPNANWYETTLEDRLALRPFIRGNLDDQCLPVDADRHASWWRQRVGDFYHPSRRTRKEPPGVYPAAGAPKPMEAPELDHETLSTLP